VNVEQAPKTLVAEADPPPERGRPLSRDQKNGHPVRLDSAGVMTMARGRGKPTQHGKPVGVVGLDDQPETREGRTGPRRMAERFVVPGKPGNAGGGKGPHFQTSERQVDNGEIGDEPTTS
jgi:hypothetical protein